MNKLCMNEQDAMNIAGIVLEIIKYNIPLDCEEDFEVLAKKLLNDLRDLGLEKTLDKWLKEEGEEVDLILNP